ncbi:unnamed protein product, partial [Polarella glacialis]
WGNLYSCASQPILFQRWSSGLCSSAEKDKMGNSKSQPVAGFSDINANMPQLEARVGRISISGRYHRLPKKLEDHYEVATKILGSGYNGVVRQATNKSSSSGGQKYAVKVRRGDVAVRIKLLEGRLGGCCFSAFVPA